MPLSGKKCQTEVFFFSEYNDFLSFLFCIAVKSRIGKSRFTLTFERFVPREKRCQDVSKVVTSRCPCCGLESVWNNTQTLLWAPAEPLLENKPCPAKRKKVEDGDGETCVICLDDCSEMAKVVTTNSCCKQTTHVACLRRYYDLPATCLNPRELRKISVQLGLPNCFICRGTSENIVPLLPEAKTSSVHAVEQRGRKRGPGPLARYV